MTALPPIVHWLGIGGFAFVGLLAARDLYRQVTRPIVPFSKGNDQ